MRRVTVIVAITGIVAAFIYTVDILTIVNAQSMITKFGYGSYGGELLNG